MLLSCRKIIHYLPPAVTHFRAPQRALKMNYWGTFAREVFVLFFSVATTHALKVRAISTNVWWYNRRGQARLQPWHERVGLFHRHPCKAAALNAKSKQDIQIPSNETEEEIKGKRGGRWHFSAVLCSKSRHRKCYYHYFTRVFPQGICTVCRYTPAEKLYIETGTVRTTSVHQTRAQLRTEPGHLKQPHKTF